MSDPRNLRLNERLKMVAGGTFQLGAALFAAAVVRAYVDGAIGLEVIGWFVVAMMLMFVAWTVLSLLETEAS